MSCSTPLSKALLEPLKRVLLLKGLVYSLLLVLGLVLTGCSSIKHFEENVEDTGPSYKPSNVYSRSKLIPVEIRRVALLPISVTSQTAFLESGAETLEPVLFAELVKTKRFEIIPVTRERLAEWTGRSDWKSDEALPQDFFRKVRRGTACDAVLFAQLTRFQPYQPIAVGWKLTLVQTTSSAVTDPADAKNTFDPIITVNSSTFWSGDEVLDSGDPSVALAARRYYREHLRNEAPAADVSTMATSPTRFGQYSLYTLLNTLPERSAR